MTKSFVGVAVELFSVLLETIEEMVFFFVAEGSHYQQYYYPIQDLNQTKISLLKSVIQIM